MRIQAMAGLAALAIATVSVAPSAQAQMYDPKYPVCMKVYQSYVDFYMECGFTSIPQCQMSASGRNAQCLVNPYYAGPAKRKQKRQRYY